MVVIQWVSDADLKWNARFKAILSRVWLNRSGTSWNNWMDKPSPEKGPLADLGAIA